MIRVIKDTDTLSQIKEQWEYLYGQAADVTPFQKYGYIQSCIDFINDQGSILYIIIVKDAQKKCITSIFPFSLSKNGFLEFINQRHTDFCLPIITPESNHYNLYKELCEWISNEKDIKGLNLINVPSWSSLLSTMKYHFKYMISHDINFYPIVPIRPRDNDKHFTDALITLPAKRRWNSKKVYNKSSETAGLKIFNLRTQPKYPEEIINSLIDTMVNRGERSTEYFSSDMLAWWKRLYENDVLSLAVISEQDIPVACTLVFIDETKNEVITWIMLYKDKSWNIPSNLFISKGIYDNGAGNLNLARGIYDYKVSNFHPDVKPLFCLKIAKSKWGHFKNIVATAFHYSKPIVKSWLGR